MRTLRLLIVFALLFGGGLALSLDHIVSAICLFVSGLALGLVWDKRNMLPE